MKSLKLDMIIEGEQLGILVRIPVDKNYSDEIEYRSYVFLEKEQRFRKLEEVVQRSKKMEQNWDNDFFEEMEDGKYISLERAFVETYFLDLKLLIKERATKHTLSEREKVEIETMKKELKEKKKDIMPIFSEIVKIFS